MVNYIDSFAVIAQNFKMRPSILHFPDFAVMTRVTMAQGKQGS